MTFFALQVRDGKEIKLADVINDDIEAAEAYCPIRMVAKGVSRHKKRRQLELVEMPLFSGYIFVRFMSEECLEERQRLIDMKWVEGFLQVNGNLLPIRDQEIDAVRRGCNLGIFDNKQAEGYRRIRPGDLVEVKDIKSVWFGYRGVFSGLFKDRQALLELSLFGRETKVMLPAQLIEQIF